MPLSTRRRYLVLLLLLIVCLAKGFFVYGTRRTNVGSKLLIFVVVVLRGDGSFRAFRALRGLPWCLHALTTGYRSCINRTVASARRERYRLASSFAARFAA